VSEMAFKKAKLVKVLDGYRKPVNIQDWLEREWSVYVEEELTQEVAYAVLQSHFEEQDWSSDYYLFDDELYVIETLEIKDPYGFEEAKQEYDGINVEALYYNGGGDFSECIIDALKKLENKL
tara:strand:- start:1370 stop:1735 length:366 start_codon:yes stop_codon:yes gene_type:complete